MPKKQGEKITNMKRFNRSMKIMQNSEYWHMLSILSIILFSTFSNHSFFAEAANVEVHIPEGANESGCEKTSECFIPFEVTISVGDTVTWINNDSSSHTVTSGDLKKDVNKIGLDYSNGFNSPLLKPGESWTHTFEKVGVYPYFSMVGLWMTGIVNVESSEMEEKIKTSNVTEPEVSEKPVMVKQNASIFIDELPPMTINEGDPILITGQLITDDGNPIAGKKITVETIDANGNSFSSDATSDKDGMFSSEAYFVFSGESSAVATFEGDSEYTSADSTMIFQVIINSQSSQTAQNKQTQEQQTTKESKPLIELPKIGGGCLIATATYGSELAPQVQMLREIRDNTVLGTQSGAVFMSAFNSFYYSFSPTVADLERQNPVFKEMVKVAITPLLSSLSLLQYVDINSDAEMLGYGIGVIMLNIGMYLILPALVMFRLAKLKHTKSIT